MNCPVYDPASNETQRHNDLNGVDEFYNPDSLNRPTTVDLQHNGTIARETYDYASTGQIHTVTRLDNRYDEFGYYLNGELFWVNYGVPAVDEPNPNETPPADDPTKEKTPEDFLSVSGWDPNQALMANRSVNYGLDNAGNRNSVNDTVNGYAAYTPDNLNRYTGQVGNDPITNGNRHEVLTYKNIEYAYKDEHLVSVINHATNDNYQLAYDALGRCVKRTVNGLTKYYIYDGDRPILEYGVAGNVSAKNVYGKGIDEILMRYDSTVKDSNLRTFYYQRDHQGSVIELTKPDGTIFERYRYDVFGTPTIYDGNWTVRTASAVSNRFMFTGREYNANLGFYEYRARAYNPLLGRFMSEDPIGFQVAGEKPSVMASLMFPTQLPKTFESSEFNLFRYCHNDPINKSDPLGLDPIAVSSGEDVVAQEGLTRDYSTMVNNAGFLGIHPYEYSTTVFRDSMGHLSLSPTETIKEIDRSRPPESSDKTSVIETHSHGLDIPYNKTTGALPSEPDIKRGNDTGRPQYVISRDGKTRQRFRPDDNPTRRAKGEGGAIEVYKDGKWIPAPGANTDLNHPGAGKNWPLSR